MDTTFRALARPSASKVHLTDIGPDHGRLPVLETAAWKQRRMETCCRCNQVMRSRGQESLNKRLLPLLATLAIVGLP